MTHTQVTNKEEIARIIRETWNSDEVFFEKYAVNETKEKSINDTTEKVLSFIESYNAEFYLLMDGLELAGYVNVSPNMNMLFSFGLKKEYRTKENKEAFLSIIDILLPNGQIVVSLYKKNTRAVNFFLNNGYEEQECITLVKSRK